MNVALLLTQSDERRLFAAWWKAESDGDSARARELFGKIAQHATNEPLPDSMREARDAARAKR